VGSRRSPGGTGSISVWFSQASGTIIITACGSDRPVSEMSSTTSSNDAESDAPGVTIGSTGDRSPSSSLSSCDCRARIQLRLPCTVLISPLCAIIRNGWASGQDGNVLVEYRECTSASLEANRWSERSG